MEKIKETIWVRTTNKTTSDFDESDNDSEPKPPKFISFSLLIGKFSFFQWLTTAVLMKLDLVVDEKKKSR